MIAKGGRKGTVRFELAAPAGAKTVELAGDFTQWRPKQMQRRNGKFVSVQTLAAGSYQYKFLIDGQWITDPDNEVCTPNCYGSLNSVAIIKA
ncbi:MAG: hypothetical protein BIFFINMI_02070 [Phycisphaerae bacterium]|nr:hypothetical protein [Phycisphaerae bacterium]